MSCELFSDFDCRCNVCAGALTRSWQPSTVWLNGLFEEAHEKENNGHHLMRLRKTFKISYATIPTAWLHFFIKVLFKTVFILFNILLNLRFSLLEPVWSRLIFFTLYGNMHRIFNRCINISIHEMFLWCLVKLVEN